MPGKAYFDKKLAEVRDMVAAGDFAEARGVLNNLSGEQDTHLMGEKTALGLPRRLHSAFLRLAKAQGDDVSRAGHQYLLVPPPDVFAPYGQFSGTERREIGAKNREPVPKILHQIWIGDKPPPVSTSAWAAHAVRHNIAYRLWREADLDREGITSNPIFARMLADGDYPGAVDVARYVILSKVGGIYLDCDFYPARDDLSFFDIVPMIGLTAFGEDVPRKTGQGSLLLANSFVASPPAHPVFSRMLDAFPQILVKLPKAPAWWATGPLIFTVVARAGSVSLAPADFVVATLPDKAPLTAIEDVRSLLGSESGGLLIAWKSW
ncbi:glycosyltransferase family 32 protein [Rhizobium skierniewicense]|uniref:glycosyltransferase family 32 protein n=1 Tax=Rhizobium skierniewicense TaxID=984260 RepID=UPI001572AF2C|nr:glycosyltransferase [Rhizobium skierniewicense]NTF33142.1 mannosyltransferase [Rhizobium skierniewicense]